MRSLIWKECRENLKLVALPAFLIFGLMALWGTPPLMDELFLFFVTLFAGLFGAVLGFLQIFLESSGDKRALLLHRPLSRSQIFLGKALAGVGLYLLALGFPCACAVGLAATPGHVDEPFGWPMLLPLLADVLAGLVYYFAGMLTAQREARWYGSRCLGLAAGLFCSMVVWTLPEFWHALLAIGSVGGLVALAAWGSFLTGGAYAPQPRLAKIALAVTLLTGLSACSFLGKSLLGLWFIGNTRSSYHLDRQGRVLVVEWGEWLSVSDLEGQRPPELKGLRNDDYALKEITAASAEGGRFPNVRSYRNRSRFVVKYGNKSRPGNETWWYVPAQGRLLGYDRQSKRLIGSFGPEGFVPPDEQPRERFPGELAYHSLGFRAWAADYLVFPGGVYTVDFRKGKVHKLFVPAAGETVVWASRWEDTLHPLALVFVGTDKAVHVLDEAGSQLVAAPLASELAGYREHRVGRLEDPQRYWIWYVPLWYQEAGAVESLPSYLVVYDSAGREISRQAVPPRPGILRVFIQPLASLVMPSVIVPSSAQAWLGLSGLVTPPAEVTLLVGTHQALVAEVRGNNGTELPLLLWLLATTQAFIPGVQGNPRAHGGLVVGFASLMLLSALLSALVCLLLARRYAFSRAHCLGWTLCGLLWGPTGLLLMLALQEWPARIACPGCRQPRLVTNDRCEHCGAAHAAPAPDGTEIFEPTVATPHAALAGR
jgi:hypothetical protein